MDVTGPNYDSSIYQNMSYDSGYDSLEPTSSRGGMATRSGKRGRPKKQQAKKSTSTPAPVAASSRGKVRGKGKGKSQVKKSRVHPYRKPAATEEEEQEEPETTAEIPAEGRWCGANCSGWLQTRPLQLQEHVHDRV